MANSEEIEQILTDIQTDLQLFSNQLKQNMGVEPKNLSQLLKKAKIIDEYNINSVNKQIRDLNSYELEHAYFKAAKAFSDFCQKGADLKKPSEIKAEIAANIEQYISAIATLKRIYKKLDEIDESGGLF